MPLFVMVIFGAIVLGAGAMLSPAYPTKQPRIALAGTLALAFIVGGTVFYSSLFGWDTLVIDYMMFALVTGIFLGGTLSVGQMRAEAKGQELLDKDQGWTGPQDLTFFAVVALLFGLPVILLQVPLGTDAQAYGYMALTTREGGTFDTLAPFLPDVQYLYSPGFSALTAYLSQQLNQGIHTVQFCVGAVLGLLNVWLAYDFGAELRDKRLGRAMGIAMLLGVAVFGMLLEGQYTALMGLAFIQAFFIFAYRYLQYGYPVDLVCAGLMLGATAISHAGSTIILLLGFVPWLVSMWLGSPKPDQQRWLWLVIGVPLVALVAVSPWVVDILPLLDDVTSPFERSATHMLVMAQNHGVIILPIALLGGWLGWQRRDLIVILAIGWLFFILDFAATGGFAALLPFITRYISPADMAWHGPILAYTILGGMGLLYLWDEVIQPRINLHITYRQSYLVNAALAAILLILSLFYEPVLNILNLPERDVSASEIEAMLWVKDHTAPDARVLGRSNWTAIITERDAVNVPQLPYATGYNETIRELLEQFWQAPQANSTILNDVTYIITAQPFVISGYQLVHSVGDVQILARQTE
ncbi:MAG: hypothetical protein CUN56_01930 [Phototrophicales bacterium]|nr:MAG: hypothetical protein CUN56_01930 [Phototrophicales bacterium]